MMNNSFDTSALIVDNLHHSFRKPTPFLEFRSDFKTVLTGINLTLDPGTITALLGRNGGGKSTLMMCMLGLIKANRGETLLLGENSWDLSDTVRQRVGYVPQNFDYFQGVHVDSLLKQWGTYYSKWDPEFVQHLLLNLELNESERVLTLSEGQRQKLAIILAMGHKPDVLILDEPVSSLDPIARLNFVKLLANDYMDETKTVLYSTHITSDVERITTHVAILKDQKILLHRELDDLKENLVKVYLSSDEDHSRLCPKSLSQRQTADGTTVIADKRLMDSAVIARSQNLGLEELYWELDQ